MLQSSNNLFAAPVRNLGIVTALFLSLTTAYAAELKQSSSQQNPVVIIPGYFGSRLEHDGAKPIAWGAFNSQSIDPRKPAEARKLALPIGTHAPIHQLDDDVFSTGILDSFQVKISGFKTERSVYKELLVATRQENRFEFHYDWRKDNVVIAQQLHQFLTEKKAKLEADRKAKYGDLARPVKFDIVAHSMGGLIARYYLRYGSQSLEQAQLNWSGTKFVDRLLLIAPPNLGSLKSLVGATDGYQAHFMLPKYSGAILSTFPSTYQLFPRDRHEQVFNEQGEPISIYDAQAWVENQWGFFNPQNATTLAALLPSKSKSERDQIALAFLTACLQRAQKFHAALDLKVEQPANLKMYLFSGDSIATPAKLKTREALQKNLSPFEIVHWSPGDDTVTKTSSLSTEQNSHSLIAFAGAYFVSADHFGLTQSGTLYGHLFKILRSQSGSDPKPKF